MFLVGTDEHIIESTITPQGLFIHIHWMNLAMCRYKINVRNSKCLSLKSAKLRVLKLFKNNFEPKKVRLWYSDRVQRKSVLQPAIRASCSLHVLAPIPFFISGINYNPSVIWISQKNSTCPSGKLRTKITSPITKSTRLSDTTFFARCTENLLKHSC